MFSCLFKFCFFVYEPVLLAETLTSSSSPLTEPPVSKNSCGDLFFRSLKSLKLVTVPGFATCSRVIPSRMSSSLTPENITLIVMSFSTFVYRTHDLGSKRYNSFFFIDTPHHCDARVRVAFQISRKETWRVVNLLSKFPGENVGGVQIDLVLLRVRPNDLHRVCVEPSQGDVRLHFDVRGLR